MEKLVNKRKSHYKMKKMHEYKFVSNHLELIEEQEYNGLNSLKVSELEKMREEKLSEENCWQLKQISALESDLHDERKLKNEAVNFNEKLELALYDLEIKLEQVKDEFAMVSENSFTTSKKIQVEKDLAGKKAFSECTVFEKTINSLDDQR